MTRPPIPPNEIRKVKRLRQRQRTNGSWRLWWEAEAAIRELGFPSVDLEPDRPTWSIREANRLNDQVTQGRPSEQVGSDGRTMSALIAQYRRDPEFTEKKLRTRKSYEGNLRIIDEKWGTAPVSAFTKPVMREWYLTSRETRGHTMAVALIRMCSILFSFAELKGWRAEDSNPCFRLKMKTPKGRSRVATWDELDALLDAAIEAGFPSIGTAALLSVLQGQRETDVIEARVKDFRQITIRGDAGQREAWAWKVDRSKRGTLGMMQLHPIVEEHVTQLVADRDPDDILLIEETTGHAYDLYLFQSRWGQVRAKAAQSCPSLTGRDQLQFRDLRRTFAVWTRAAGTSKSDAADVLGNSAAQDPRLQDTYMPDSFDTASRAVLAIARPEKEKRRKA